MSDQPFAGGASPELAARAALLALLRRDEQARSRSFARTMRLRAALSERWGADADVILELAGTARIGQGRASTELVWGRRLADLFPRALQLLETGLLRQGTVEILLRVTARCTDEVQAEVGRRLLDRLVDLDAADARRLIAATVPEVEADLDLAEQERAHAQAKADRGVWVKPVEDGMAVIGCTTDQLSAHRFSLDLAELVRAQGVADAASGVTRTKAQREADVLSELPTRYLALARALRAGKTDALLAAAGLAPGAGQLTLDDLDLPPGPQPRAWERDPDELVAALLRQPVHKPCVLNVHTAMTTLLELDHRSGYVEGLGPVPAHLVRLLVPDAGLRRIAVNARTGLPYGIDPTIHPPVDVSRYAGHGGRGPDPGGRGPARPPHGPPDGPPTPHDTDDPTLRAELERERLLSLLGPLRLRETAEPRHDPSTGLRRHVEVRDLACTGPGCSRTARSCDLDHADEHARGGPTASWNLFVTSRRCHLAKHRDWTVEHDLDTGATTWRSPAGGVYTRLGAWQSHRPLDDELVLPLPRLAVLPVLARTRAEREEPAPVRRQAQPSSTALARQAGGWGDGPAPF